LLDHPKFHSGSKLFSENEVEQEAAARSIRNGELPG
jgi:hypothetical protein